MANLDKISLGKFGWNSSTTASTNIKNSVTQVIRMRGGGNTIAAHQPRYIINTIYRGLEISHDTITMQITIVISSYNRYIAHPCPRHN